MDNTTRPQWLCRLAVRPGSTGTVPVLKACRPGIPAGYSAVRGPGPRGSREKTFNIIIILLNKENTEQSAC